MFNLQPTSFNDWKYHWTKCFVNDMCLIVLNIMVCVQKEIAADDAVLDEFLFWNWNKAHESACRNNWFNILGCNTELIHIWKISKLHSRTAVVGLWHKGGIIHKFQLYVYIRRVWKSGVRGNKLTNRTSVLQWIH